MVPHDIFYTYYTVLATKSIGPNLKLFAILLLPVPLLTWPPLVCFSSIFFGAFYGIGLPVVRTFDEEYDIFCGGIILMQIAFYILIRDKVISIREK